MFAFLRAAPNGNRIAARVFERRRRMTQSIIEDVARCFFYADLSRTNTALTEPFCRNCVRALVLLPYAYLNRQAELLAQPSFFEGRADDQGVAFAWDQ